jgi:hypothetical protein
MQQDDAGLRRQDAGRTWVTSPSLASNLGHASKLLVMVRPEGFEPPTLWFVATEYPLISMTSNATKWNLAQ